MKIGIDAIWLFRGPISGILFIQNVLPELFRLQPEIEWHLFLNKSDKHCGLPFKKENIKIHYVWAKPKMIANLFIIPWYAKKLKLNAVLFQTFSPKRKSFKSIVFIHDELLEITLNIFPGKRNYIFSL